MSNIKNRPITGKIADFKVERNFYETLKGLQAKLLYAEKESEQSEIVEKIRTLQDALKEIITSIQYWEQRYPRNQTIICSLYDRYLENSLKLDQNLSRFELITHEVIERGESLVSASRGGTL